MINESWKSIEEFPIYSVSNLGKVRNEETGNILIGGYDKDKYRQVTLCYKGKQYNRRICRLVAIAFIPNPHNLPQVNHKDEDKENDAYYNLEWCTVEYNNNYGQRTNETRKKIICVETGKIYEGLRVAERYTGISHNSISRACKKGAVAGGFHWQYVYE